VTPTVTLIDYGAGNVTSVERALHKLGAESIRANAPNQIEQARAIVLPGVGHFAALIRALDEHNLRAPLLSALDRGVPFLGICLGLQALYEASEEAPELLGLKQFSGKVLFRSLVRRLCHRQRAGSRRNMRSRLRIRRRPRTQKHPRRPIPSGKKRPARRATS
jgi:imidazole glycerol phosphate synthase glutamine amidotransferase subunit